MERNDKGTGLLEGLRILDLADEKASFCSKLFADMGARVIKVEKTGGDPSRRIGPFFGKTPDPEKSLSFYYHNTNKLGITLDLEHEEGKKIFLKLLKDTDIVVETFCPGYLSEIGLDFDGLKGSNPKLIWASVTGFGENGPRSRYRSCDLVASAYGGQMYVTGSPSAFPLKAFGQQSYYSASLFAAVGILLALRKRTKRGEGGHIDISLQESVTSTLDHVMVRFFHEKTIARRQGSVSWNRSFCILPCKDGHILLAPFPQWETLVEWMESEGMAEDLGDERYREEEFRMANIDHIFRVLEQWTRTHTREELFESGQLLRFPWAPVLSPRDVLSNPQLQAREFFVDVDHPERGRSISYPASPYKFSRSSPCRRKRAPLIGEDNVRIYQKEIGLSEEEYMRLSSLNVI